jgi:hypothetical protein
MGELPTENLFRAISPQLAKIEVRDEGSDPVLSVRFAAFDEWAEIDSVYEGHFLERFAPGSLDDSLSSETPKILFQHGKDPELGNKVIAAPVTTRTDSQYAYLEGPLLDGVPPLIVSGLRHGVYGASMQFAAEEQTVVRNAKKSDYNPQGLTERTVTKARVREGGPVTWGAYASPTASIRSLTDEYQHVDFDAQIAYMAREHPQELASRIQKALKAVEQPQESPRVSTPTAQPKFRSREEYLAWIALR